MPKLSLDPGSTPVASAVVAPLAADPGSSPDPEPEVAYCESISPDPGEIQCDLSVGHDGPHRAQYVSAEYGIDVHEWGGVDELDVARARIAQLEQELNEANARVRVEAKLSAERALSDTAAALELAVEVAARVGFKGITTGMSLQAICSALMRALPGHDLRPQASPTTAHGEQSCFPGHPAPVLPSGAVVATLPELLLELAHFRANDIAYFAAEGGPAGDLERKAYNLATLLERIMGECSGASRPLSPTPPPRGEWASPLPSREKALQLAFQEGWHSRGANLWPASIQAWTNSESFRKARLSSRCSPLCVCLGCLTDALAKETEADRKRAAGPS